MGMSYSNPSGMTAEEREQARQEARQEDRAEAVEEHRGDAAHYQYASEKYGTDDPTLFMDYSLNGLKAMLATTNASGIQGAGEKWQTTHDQLVGADGSGSGDCVYGLLKKAVDSVLEHWEGESANRFRTKASEILGDIYNTGTHCATVSSATKQAAEDLRNQKGRLDDLEEPSWFDRAGDLLTDSGRDDSYTQEDIQNKNLPKDVIAEIDEDHLSAGMEVKLQGAAIMETLARNYVAYKQRIQSKGDWDDDRGIPPSAPAVPMPAPVPPFSGSSPTPGRSGGRQSWSTQPARGSMPSALTGPRDSAISGGQQVPASKTKLDGLPTGITDRPDALPNGGQAGRNTGPTTTTGPGGPNVAPTTGRLGGPGPRSGGPTGRSTGPRGGIRGGPGGGEARGRAAGGIRGGGGTGGSGRAGASGGRGPLARAKGGVVGAPKGLSGGKPATPGGTGLGKGRGGASGSGNGTRGGMLAGRMGSNQRPGEEEREQGDRPDYLVEDEETWTPEDGRSVPRTIE